MNDTRLNQTDLDAAVDFAYGGAAVREGRKAQARTLRALFRRATPGNNKFRLASPHKG